MYVGRILLRKPTNEYDNYVWTFPKGRPDKGESAEQAAIREVREEGGVDASIVSDIPGRFKGGTGTTVYYRMKLVKDHGDFDRKESEEVIWATPSEARKLISKTRNVIGRKRDLDVLEAVTALDARDSKE
jgi:8-oxo-dGTP diphosphatase